MHCSTMREASADVLRPLVRTLARTASLEADVTRTDDAYRVVVDAPGVTAEGVTIAYVDGGIDITIDRLRSDSDEFRLVVPGRPTRYTDHIPLPADARVDPEAANAVLTDRGTLEITLPRTDS